MYKKYIFMQALLFCTSLLLCAPSYSRRPSKQLQRRIKKEIRKLEEQKKRGRGLSSYDESRLQDLKRSLNISAQKKQKPYPGEAVPYQPINNS